MHRLDWSGYYFGGSIGYGLGHNDLNISGFTTNGVSIPGTASGVAKPAGVISGIYYGYNWQGASNLVLGVETDIQGSGQGDNATTSGAVSSTLCFGDPSTPCNLTGTGSSILTTKIDWFGTFRGRVGLAAGNLLFYGTGGLAYGQVKTSLTAALSGTFADTGGICDGGGAGCPLSGGASFSHSNTQVGWTLGAGIEGAISAAPNWIWRAEYLYIDLGNVNSQTPYTSSVSVPAIPLTLAASGLAVNTTHVTNQVLRLGISYKFAP